jgi:hypothetical protein
MKAHNERNSEAVVNIRKPRCSARERILEAALNCPLPFVYVQKEQEVQNMRSIEILLMRRK